MASSSTTRFGKLLRDSRKRVGLSPRKLASYLNEDAQLIKELEAGRSEPSSDSAFCERLQAVPGFTELDITLLLEAAETDKSTAEDHARSDADKFIYDLVKLLAIVLKDSAKLGAYYRHQKELQEDDQLLSLVRRVLVETEAAQVALTKLLPADTTGLAIMPVRSPSTTLGLSPNIVVTAEIPISYSHTSVLDHAPQIIKEEKLQPRNKQGQSPQARIKAHQEKGRKTGDIVYERGRARYNREHLQATSGTLAKLLIDAVKNPDDALSSAAVQALGGFAEEAVKIRGISANSAAQEYNVPTNFLLRWAKQVGVIPILSEGIGPGSPIFLDREKAQEAANIYHEAKRQGIQPLKLLERTASSRF